MLEDNILYKIYKSGKIPVIRFKNEGFKNYNQAPFFAENLDEKEAKIMKEKYKDVNGCFCILGGMQDRFILSGVEDTDLLHIGYIDKDTKVFNIREDKWIPAETVFNTALSVYKKIEDAENIPNKYKIIDKHMDDFDLVYTQAIVNADDITEVTVYDYEKRKELLSTIEDGFFGIDTAIGYYYLYSDLGILNEFLDFIDKKEVFNELLRHLSRNEIFFKSIASDDYFELLELGDTHFAQTLINSSVPAKSTEHFQYKNEIKDILDKYKDIDMIISGRYVALNFESIYEGKNIKFSIHLSNDDISIKGYSKETFQEIKVKTDLQTLLNNKEFVSNFSKNLNIFKEVLDILPQYKINNINFKDNINNINQFLENNPDVYIADDNIIYTNKDFLVEYNFLLDDAIILSNDDEIVMNEEDILLKCPNAKDLLNKIYDFRNLVLNNNTQNKQYNSLNIAK